MSFNLRIEKRKNERRSRTLVKDAVESFSRITFECSKAGMFMQNHYNKGRKFTDKEAASLELVLPPDFFLKMEDEIGISEPYRFNELKFFRKVTFEGTLLEQIKQNTIYVTEISIPFGCKFLPAYSLYKFKALQRVHLPNELEGIGICAMSDCPIKELTLPDSVHEIAMSAFDACKNLEHVTLSKSLEVLPTFCFAKCAALREINFPDSLKVISANCFYKCISLTEVYLPDTIAELGTDAFRMCTGIRKVRLSNSLSVIPEGCFSGCDGLTEIDIPASVQTLNMFAFNGSMELKKIVLHSKVRIDKETTLPKKIMLNGGKLKKSRSLKIYIPEEFRNYYTNPRNKISKDIQLISRKLIFFND